MFKDKYFRIWKRKAAGIDGEQALSIHYLLKASFTYEHACRDNQLKACFNTSGFAVFVE